MTQENLSLKDIINRSNRTITTSLPNYNINKNIHTNNQIK